MSARLARAPYGQWRSPISARDVARGGVRFGRVDFGADGGLWWSEGRPNEGGRSVVMRRTADGAIVDVLPQGWNARTRVHEYGGRAWIPVGDTGLVFANWDDQRLYVLDVPVPGAIDGASVRHGTRAEAEPRPITPEPAEAQGDRFADLVLGHAGSEVICVRERVVDGGRSVERDIVAVPLDGSMAVRTLVVDGHFLSNPRPAPDGRHLAWLTWEHPRMPWDGTELRVGEIAADGSVSSPRTLLGGEAESVFQPEWSGPDALHAVSDRSGWWNLYRVDMGGGTATGSGRDRAGPTAGGVAGGTTGSVAGGTTGGMLAEVQALCEREEEFARAQWIFGMSTYGVLDDGRIAVLHGRGTWSLSLLDEGRSTLLPASPELAERLTYFEPALAVSGHVLAVVGGGSATPLSVVRLDTRTGVSELVRSSIDVVPDAAYLPAARAEEFVGEGGRDVHAFVYAPKNPLFAASEGERPPYVALVHGGPTSQASPVLDLEVAYFTSRGIGVVDVDYAGSTGYGREYRRRLDGQWGVVDVEDVIAVVRGLAERGEADPRRLVIRGRSAGGWTVLVALTRSDVFAAGASYYGVADLAGLAEDTHDFEARYIDGLVGPLPEALDLYEDRSPLSHVDDLDCPILLLQGTEDKIVTPRQAEMFRDAMVRKGIAHAYIAFEGEQHGFRRAESIERALEAELSFYGQVLGFEPPDVPVLALTRATGGADPPLNGAS